MKALAILLLLLNVAYVAFIQFGGRANDNALPQASAPGQSRFVQAKDHLMLVSERLPVPADPPPVVAEIPVESETPPAPDVTEPLASETLPPAPVVSTAPAVAVEPEPAPVPVIEPWCAMVSGFASEEEASAFLSAMKTLGGSGELQSEQVPISSTWWVHLPPFPTAEQTAQMLAELRAKQIDNYLVRTGELAGAISLGVFRSSQRAGVMQQELNALGYSPSIHEMVRRETRFNASVRLEDMQLRQQSEWANLEAGLQDVDLQEIACK